MRRWLPLVCGLILLVVAGCAMFERRPVDPGPDGVWGTPDDVYMSDAEKVGDLARGVSEAVGFGWIGMAVQGLSILGTNVAMARRG